MFGLTILSTLFAGGIYQYVSDHPDQAERLSRDMLLWMKVGIREMPTGWPFALSILLILVAHELGHYFAARYHKVAVTLPYFVPLPISPLGTMGAVIRLKEPPTNKRVLLDIGIAGPLAGFIVAVPIVIYGLITSAPLRSLPPDPLLSFEGNSVVYVLLKYAVFGKFLPMPASFGNLPAWLFMLRFYILGIFPPVGGQDVFINQVALAGWAGLLVTGLNLIPAGQLDGGHALYVLVGQRARRLLPFILVILIGLGFFWPGWLLWAAIIYFLGRIYAEPLDQITELDPKRKALAILALILFVLVFTPIPG
jgi:membrane-associated protease RseP (regulator of RpoE activity)